MSSSRHSEATKHLRHQALGSLLVLIIGLFATAGELTAVEGTVIAWGDNSQSESTTPTNLTEVVAIAAGARHNLALRRSGKVVAWGENSEGQTDVPPDLGNVVAVAAGDLHSMALARDGRVFAWGNNFHGQSTVPPGLTGVVAIAAGGSFSLALRSDGTVKAWGRDAFGELSGAEGLTNIVAIAAGSQHAIALKNDSTVVAWGFNANGESSVPPGLDNVVAIAAGNDHSLALKRNGTVIAWGLNQTGQTSVPDDLSDVAAIAGGSTHSLALRSNGAVVSWGDKASGKTIVPTGLTNVVAIAAGDYHSLALSGFALFAPVVFLDGILAAGTNAAVRGPTTVSMFTTYQNGTLLFTLDGSAPDFTAGLYEGPFTLNKSATLRATAYNADFTQSVETDPLEIIILPTLNAGTKGGGIVAVDPPAGAYFSNDLAVVTAIPSPGWTFLHWLGDETGTIPIRNVSMSRNKCVQAVFGTALSGAVVGSGSVVRSPTAELYPYGTPVRLTALPQAGNYFAFWGNAATGTNNPLTFAVTNSNPTVTAVFAPLPENQHALTVVPDGFGTVTNSPRGNRFGNGTNITLRALPEPEQDFLGWSGDASGTNNPLVVTMAQSKVITANFTKRPRLAPILCEGALNGAEFQLLITGEFGGRYSLEATTNLAPTAPAWEPLATLTNTFGSVQFNNAMPTNRPQRFYRAIGQ